MKTLIHTFVFGKSIIMSSQVPPLLLIKHFSEFAVALLLSPSSLDSGYSIAIGDSYSRFVRFRTTEKFWLTVSQISESRGIV
jgi:hypothetical protein